MADAGTPPPEQLTPEQQAEKAADDAAYGKFKAWLDRYAEENKPADPPPDKTTKPANSLFATLFGG